MSGCLDRLDRMVLGLELTTRPVVVAHAPVAALSTRGPRFVGHAVCPMCGVDGIGVEYHGELMTGAKVHQLAAHTAGMRRVDRMQPRCLGAGMKVTWKGAPAP